jgi:hypothetical protein
VLVVPWSIAPTKSGMSFSLRGRERGGGVPARTERTRSGG